MKSATCLPSINNAGHFAFHVSFRFVSFASQDHKLCALRTCSSGLVS